MEGGREGEGGEGGTERGKEGREGERGEGGEGGRGKEGREGERRESFDAVVLFIKHTNHEHICSMYIYSFSPPSPKDLYKHTLDKVVVVLVLC